MVERCYGILRRINTISGGCREYIYRHHVAPRGQPCVPEEVPNSSEVLWREQTNTHLDNLEKGSKLKR